MLLWLKVQVLEWVNSYELEPSILGSLLLRIESLLWSFYLYQREMDTIGFLQMKFNFEICSGIKGKDIYHALYSSPTLLVLRRNACTQAVHFIIYSCYNRDGTYWKAIYHNYIEIYFCWRQKCCKGLNPPLGILETCCLSSQMSFEFTLKSGKTLELTGTLNVLNTN